jgi:hypothetical protein
MIWVFIIANAISLGIFAFADHKMGRERERGCGYFGGMEGFIMLVIFALLFVPSNSILYSLSDFNILQQGWCSK